MKLNKHELLNKDKVHIHKVLNEYKIMNKNKIAE